MQVKVIHTDINGFVVERHCDLDEALAWGMNLLEHYPDSILEIKELPAVNEIVSLFEEINLLAVIPVLV